MYAETKRCKKCGGSDFGSQNQCKPCRAIWQRAWYAKNTAKAYASSAAWRKANPRAAVTHRRRHELRRYGLTQEKYQDLLDAQGGLCAICESDEPGPPGKYFHIDHSHATGKIRGLLCCSCNFMLGLAKNSITTLHRAADYLEIY